MQSTTTGNPYAECMASCGEWAQTWNLTPQQRVTAVNAYNEFYGIYLQTRSGAIVPRAAPPATRTGAQQPQRQRTQRARQNTGAAATPRQRQRPAAARTTTPATRRVRTTPGQVGVVDSKVLDVVVKNPNITTERLLGRAALRDETGKDMTANILGTCISRLLKGGYIAGTAKVGPFSATPIGINAVRKQPTSINQARNQRRRAATTATTVEQPTAATA